ncbi:phosphatidylethanolamine N-methyltransferase [Acididesulfobacillus acetoxydans]|uniref:Phosphatidylethanolamine N-methyltransferase n=1 Tax=Acididesulfobacillus acetoxydans TaxID=1561005 RepID=A0A8S0W6E1_9FIRM|nr:23S rRNA (pseudouridine(1915)-N(3))-methyltransferase RlmH [Acididesulfobacillus acetoxydans]CAA7599769.1 phosphatidylethanolamine N-methyltransferase [Acididesulfobacillus acetoxydans]CEJ07335.1 Predicted SPOUT methyltransferase [Acididesulfobacillus acetoxydans]
MNFTVYLLGGKIGGFYVEALHEYEKRLSRYCRIRRVCFASGEQLTSALSPRTHKILISRRGGKSLSSEALADRINTLTLAGISETALILSAPDLLPARAGPFPSSPLNVPEKTGLSPGADYEILTLTALDMNLGLQATLVYEQIYRAFRILRHEPYHK